jgi:hypothetical protein
MRAITDMSTPKSHVGMRRYVTETTSTSSTRAIGTPSMAIIGMSTQGPKPELAGIIPRIAVRSADLAGRPSVARNTGHAHSGYVRRAGDRAGSSLTT